MKLLRRRALPILLGLIVSVTFGWLLLSGIDLQDVRASAGEANWGLMLASLAVRGGSFAFATLRAMLVFGAVATIPWKTQLEGLTIAYVGNTVLPFRMGLVLRVAHLSRESDTPPETVLGAIGAERIVDVGILLLLALAMLPTLASRGATPAAVTGVATTLGTLLVALVVIAPRADALATYLPAAIGQRVSGLFRGIRALGTPKRLFGAIALTMAFWFCQATTVMLWLAAFDLPTPLWASGAFLVLVAFGGMIPSGPAFAGPWHYFAALTARLVGAAEAKAAAFAIVAHFVSFVPLTLLGLGWLWTRFVTVLSEAE